MWSNWIAREPSSTALRATVLLVDDEPNILRSLQRVLRREPYRLLLAADAEQALSLLRAETIDLVVSDVRMPGMDGVEFLTQVEQAWPDCMRILLTGYAEVESTIKAINEGRIYRYISKPWSDDELRQILAQSLDHRQTELERRRLLQLTREQNAALADINASLELRVRERTSALETANALLDRAHAELQQSYVVATQVFSSLLSQRLPGNRQSNREVIALSTAMAKALELPEDDSRNLTMAAALYNLGKLTWNDEMIVMPPDRMNREQRLRFREYPAQGQHLLMALEPAQDAALIIRSHQERFDGAGFPDGLAGTAIALGARILKLCVDYVELQMGMVLSRKLKREEVLRAIPGYAGRLYDPDLCPVFIEVADALASAQETLEPGVLCVGSHQLEPGMTLVRKLYSAEGTLLLSDGKVFTTGLIEKLQTFEANERAQYALYVAPPVVEDDES